MAFHRIPYKNVKELLRSELLDTDEVKTTALVWRLRGARKRKVLSRAEFLSICRWKSPRSIRSCEKNSTVAIRRMTRTALTSWNEQEKLEALTLLNGVGVPTASAILSLTDPQKYGVIDIRVWQLLHRLRAVKRKPSGIGFTFKDWYHYLSILRYFADELRTSTRLVEWTLFTCHKKWQQGNLYKNRGHVDR